MREEYRAEDFPDGLKRGCDLCSDFPVHLHGRCHPSAPLRAMLTDEHTMELRCYVPACNRLVATFKVNL